MLVLEYCARTRVLLEYHFWANRTRNPWYSVSTRRGGVAPIWDISTNGTVSAIFRKLVKIKFSNSVIERSLILHSFQTNLPARGFRI